MKYLCWFFIQVCVCVSHLIRLSFNYSLRLASTEIEANSLRWESLIYMNYWCDFASRYLIRDSMIYTARCWRWSRWPLLIFILDIIENRRTMIACLRSSKSCDLFDPWGPIYGNVARLLEGQPSTLLAFVTMVHPSKDSFAFQTHLLLSIETIHR